MAHELVFVWGKGLAWLQLCFNHLQCHTIPAMTQVFLVFQTRNSAILRWMVTNTRTIEENKPVWRDRRFYDLVCKHECEWSQWGGRAGLVINSQWQVSSEWDGTAREWPITVRNSIDLSKQCTAIVPVLPGSSQISWLHTQGSASVVLTVWSSERGWHTTRQDDS